MRYRLLLRHAASAAALALALLPGSAAAVETTFSVRIPDRAPEFPVGRVKITLETAGSPAGATLRIDGSPPLNFNPLLQPLPSLDGVFFYQDGAANRVIIDFAPLSNLAGGTDYCVAAGGASFPDDHELKFNGPSITGYRINSYTAASPDSCGTVQCAQRRINNNPAVWKIQPTGTDLGRHALDVILVLDESGSMSSIVTGSGGETKMALMQWAVEQFVDAWKAEGTRVPQDRLGVVFFTTGATAPLVPFFIERGPDGPGNTIPDPHPWDAIIDAVNARSPDDLTALGKGMQLGIDKWVDDPANDANIVVMTNGLQNVDPEVNPYDSDPSLLALFDPSPPSGAPREIPLVERCGITFQTIGVGAPATVQSDLLDEIAAETGGATNVTIPDKIDLSFRDTLLEVLKGDTLQLLGEQLATLAPGQLAGADLSVNLNSSASQGLVLLGWRGPRFNLEIEMVPPGGGAPIVPPILVNKTFHTVQAFTLPASGPPGLWTVRVRRKPSSTNIAVPYHLSVMAVEDAFSYRARLGKTAYRAGEDLTLHVEVSEGKVALPGLGGAITAQVARPPQPLGTLLHRTQVDQNILGTNPPGIDPDQFPNASARKLFHLVENQSLLDAITPRAAETVTLLDDGNSAHGDRRANDGVYSARISNTEVPGRYVFRIAINATTPVSGKVVREEELETEIRVGRADRGESEIDAAPLATAGDFLITVVPADRFGNFFGPDFEDFIAVEVSGGGTVVPPIVDERANGTYTVRLTGVPSGANPDVKVSVEGETLAEEPLSELGQTNRRFSVFAGYGVTIPRGALATAFESSGSWELGFEYRPFNRWSLELAAARDRLAGGPAEADALHIRRLALSAKFYALVGTANLALFGGPAVFDFDEADTTRSGFDVGSVFECRATTRWSVEAALILHRITAGTELRYGTSEFHLRYRF